MHLIKNYQYRKMDHDIPEKPEPTTLIESKKYELNYEEDTYSLLIETYSKHIQMKLYFFN